MKEIKTARLAKAGIMIALAFILSYVESLLPSFTAIPGIKIGLANIVTTVALYVLNWKYAVAVSLVRVILSGLIFSGMSAMLYGLAGAVLSLIVMIILKSMFSVPAVSVAGGVAHNLGQILVALAVLGNAVLYYLPVLIISGLVAGLATGIISALLIKRIPKQ